MTGVSKLSLQLLSNHINPIHPADRGLHRKSKEGGAKFPRDSERLVFNQLLSPQLIGLLGPKAI